MTKARRQHWVWQLQVWRAFHLPFVLYWALVPAEDSLMSFCTFSVLLVLYLPKGQAGWAGVPG
jgi:hypothetical protein